MRRSSVGKQWEDLNERRQRAANQELAAQRAAANQAVRAQAGGLRSLMSMNAALPVGEPHYFQESRSRFYRRRDDILPELEAQEDCPPQYREQAPLTPPASEGGSPQEEDSNELIRHLQEEIVQNEITIKRLESELESEKGNRRRLQAERHEAVDLQRKAEGEMRKLRKQVANLDQLLDGSIKRQKELESELDLCRQESSDLKRQLHEERDSHESDIRTRETRERQLEYANRALQDGVGSQRRHDRYGGSRLEEEAQSMANPQREGASHHRRTNEFMIDAPIRSRRHSRGTTGRAYVSIPKDGNRRAFFVLS